MRTRFLFCLMMSALSLLVMTPASQARIVQLTRHANIDFGDPSAPIFARGQVVVTVTGGFVLVWNSERAFFSGGRPSVERLRICHHDGTPLSDEAGEDIWGPTFNGNVLVGSVMVPRSGQRNALWPDDAPSRRTFAFHFVKGCWIRALRPLFGTTGGWIGHTYGHTFFENLLFYERVAQVKDGMPWVTNLYALHRGREILILDSRRWPSARRSFGGSLVEGARPFKVGQTYFLSFSAGDYNSDAYGIHLLRAARPEGPYEPLLNARGNDLRDFGQEIEREMPLTWGPGRAVFFERGGRWWILFHGIRKPFQGTDGHRQLFLMPANMEAFELGGRREMSRRDASP